MIVWVEEVTSALWTMLTQQMGRMGIARLPPGIGCLNSLNTGAKIWWCPTLKTPTRNPDDPPKPTSNGNGSGVKAYPLGPQLKTYGTFTNLHNTSLCKISCFFIWNVFKKAKKNWPPIWPQIWPPNWTLIWPLIWQPIWPKIWPKTWPLIWLLFQVSITPKSYQACPCFRKGVSNYPIVALGRPEGVHIRRGCDWWKLKTPQWGPTARSPWENAKTPQVLIKNLTHKTHYCNTRMNLKRIGTFWFCLPGLLGIYGNPKQKEFLNTCESFLR